MSLRALFHLGGSNEDRISEALAASGTPSIGSPKELETYLAHKTNDAEFAKVFVAIMDKTVEEVAIEMKRGGDGDPYQVEYVKSKSFKKMTKKEVKKRKQQIVESLERDHGLAPDDVDKLQNELAQLADHHAIIWVNSPSEEDFSAKERLFSDALRTRKTIDSEMAQV